jgi:hypothetical protein
MPCIIRQAIVIHLKNRHLFTFRCCHLPFLLTPLESPAIYGGDSTDRISIPYREGRVKAPFFLTGLTPSYKKVDW